MTTVFVALDGTDDGIEVARTAKSLFGDAANYFTVTSSPVEATSPFELTLTSDSTPIGAEARDSATDAIDHATERASGFASAAGVGALATGAMDDPVAAIAQAADEHHADVIVVGAHCRGWFSRLLTRSVAHGVENCGYVPVLVVPTGG